MNDILNVVGEPVAWRVRIEDSRMVSGYHYRFATHKSTYHDMKQDPLYTESQILAAYSNGKSDGFTAGQEDMREKLIAKLLELGVLGDGEYIDAIRALPIEGEQG